MGLADARAPDGRVANGRACGRRASVSDLTGGVVGLLALLAWDASGLDWALVRAFGDANGFVPRHHRWLEGAMHPVASLLAGAVLAALTLNVWRPLPFARALPRSQRLRWWGATLACLAAVALVRHGSASSCPWSMAAFGGPVSAWVSHWALGLADGGPGRCFPSAHAACAFAFVPGWFALRDAATRAARWWSAGVVVAGLLIAAVQTARGAHYPGDCAWTAWLCFAIAASAHHVRLPRRRPG